MSCFCFFATLASSGNRLRSPVGLLLDREILGLSDSLSARCAVRASLPKYAMSSGGPSANAAASSVAREEISYAAFLAREFGCTSPSLGMTEDGASTRPCSKVVVAAATRRRLARPLSREAPQWWTPPPPGAPEPEPELSDSDECPTPRVKRSTPSGPSPSSLCERDDNGRIAGNSIGDIATSELFGTECDRSDSDREAVREACDGCESEVECTGIGFVSRIDGRIGDAASEATPGEQRQIALWCDGRLNQGQAVVGLQLICLLSQVSWRSSRLACLWLQRLHGSRRGSRATALPHHIQSMHVSER